jgi:hypothetical protein
VLCLGSQARAPSCVKPWHSKPSSPTGRAMAVEAELVRVLHLDHLARAPLYTEPRWSRPSLPTCCTMAAGSGVRMPPQGPAAAMRRCRKWKQGEERVGAKLSFPTLDSQKSQYSIMSLLGINFKDDVREGNTKFSMTNQRYMMFSMAWKELIILINI